MTRRWLVLFFALLIPLTTLGVLQTAPAPRIEITGVNPSDFPTVIVTANVYDTISQPARDLDVSSFAIVGELADRARIVSVESLSDENLPFAVVLAIDVSSSMAGQPFIRAQEAARSFIESIGPNDPVAIVTFSTTAQVVQDYTTDKAVLLSAVDNLGYGGETALYQGSLLAVEKAAEAPTNRRAVILLSDGAEFGGRSSASRTDAPEQAIIRGVPVYTVGLGFGTDRTYLEEISSSTNALYNESPDETLLLSIYQELAALLRSQYVITLAVDLPADGQEYDLTVQTNTPQGTAEATATLRTPIPTPIISALALPTSPISETTSIPVEIGADQALTSVTAQFNDTEPITLTEPYAVIIDPLISAPGAYTLTITAADEDGDTGTQTGTFEIAALPPVVSISTLPSGEIAEPQTVTVDVTGQTPGASVSFSIDGGDAVTDDAAPFEFTIDPQQLAPGAHTLTVAATNAAGVSAETSQDFTVAALPPTLTFSGLESGTEITDSATVTVEGSAQTAISSVTFSVNGSEAASASEVPASITLNALDLPPGPGQLVVDVVTQSGVTGQGVLDFTVAALAPEFSVTGLEAGQTLSENVTLEVSADDAANQTDLTGVTYSVDGSQIAASSAAPFSAELDILAVGPGPHILTITAANAGGQSTSQDIAFLVDEAPSLTATATLFTSTPTTEPTSTATPRPTSTIAPSSTPAPTEEETATPDEGFGIGGGGDGETETPTPTNDPQGTADARSTIGALSTQSVAAALAAQQTATSAAESATATPDLRGTANAQLTNVANATSEAIATSDAAVRATETAFAAANADATGTAQAAVDADATAFAIATTDAQSTADAVAAAVTEEPTETEEVAPTVESTATDEPTTVAQVATEATEDATEDAARTPNPSATPIGTLIPAGAETTPASNNIVPIAILCVVAALILLVIFVLFGRRGRKSTR